MAYSRSTPVRVDANEYSTKKEAEEHIREVESPYSNAETGRLPTNVEWQPGFLTRFPKLGFGALFVVILCAVASVVTLLVSDGKTQSHWPKAVAPNVILSGLGSVSSICFSIAIGNGVAIAWWRQTLKGATIEQLHTSWSFSTSMKEVAMAGRGFNLIALAALTTKLTIIDSVLLQRATSTETWMDTRSQPLEVWAKFNETFPITGRTVGAENAPGLMTQYVSQDLQIWAQNPTLLLPSMFGECDGVCFLNVPAAGFGFDCTAPVSKHIDYGKETMAASDAEINGTLNQTSLVVDETVFSLSFGSQYSDYDENQNLVGPANLTMDLLWTQAYDAEDNNAGICPGTRYK